MKWAAVTVRARSEADFVLLTQMLTALGFSADRMEDYKKYRLQMFHPTDLIFEVVHRENLCDYADLDLTISDPDSAVQVIKKLGLEIANDSSSNESKQTVRSFDLVLPGGTTVCFTGIRSVDPEPSSSSSFEGTLSAADKTFAIVVSRFNSFITERLLAGAVDALRRCGVDRGKGYDIIRVPGSFEIPSAARSLAETRKYNAIICIGCVLRGDTAHYDVIVNEVTRGIGQSAQETGIPHALGVLTCDTLEQAIDRAGLKMGNKGFEAALAAVEMASLSVAIKGQRSGPRLQSRAAIKKSSGRDASTADKARVPRALSSAQHDRRKETRKKSR
jgi:6,7-dimethyl-8-ribityllumazine synthase